MRKKKNTHTHTIVCLRSDFVFRYNGGDGPERILCSYNVVIVGVFVCMKGDNIKLQLLLLEFIHL